MKIAFVGGPLCGEIIDLPTSTHEWLHPAGPPKGELVMIAPEDAVPELSKLVCDRYERRLFKPYPGAASYAKMIHTGQVIR